MIDSYIKIVLTIIATSLVALVLQNSFPAARAQIPATCGHTAADACYVTAAQPFFVQSSPRDPVYVAGSSRDPLYVTAPLHLPVSVQINR